MKSLVNAMIQAFKQKTAQHKERTISVSAFFFKTSTGQGATKSFFRQYFLDIRLSSLLKVRVKLTLTRTAALLIMLKIGNQMPISRARSGTGRRVATTYLYASTRISKKLFNKAKSGASGNADTKRVTKPNCITESIFASFGKN